MAVLSLVAAFAAIWLVSRLDQRFKGFGLLQSNTGSGRSSQTADDPAFEHAPYPIWVTDEGGRVIRANPAYLALAAKCLDPDETGALPVLFGGNDPDERPGVAYRRSLHLADDSAPLWFDVTETEHGPIRIHYAADANAMVKAETAQRNFVQTLTKTFAQLSIGLAIFDRNRQLALFNPALIDLTALPADFLSARPNLQSFFDRMRENRMIPEPKNYSSWREQIADVVIAATDGRYSETWTLPSGLTYRVTGRPHPDGAVAFLFEDISAEISLTRRFRAELEMGQSVLDSLDDAICVFTSTGTLTSSNKAYRQIWQVNPDAAFAEITIRDAAEHWQAANPTHPSWSQLRDFVGAFGVREPWQGQLQSPSGEVLTVTASPIFAGATLVRFSRDACSDTDQGPALDRAVQPDR